MKLFAKLFGAKQSTQDAPAEPVRQGTTSHQEVDAGARAETPVAALPVTYSPEHRLEWWGFDGIRFGTNARTDIERIFGPCEDAKTSIDLVILAYPSRGVTFLFEPPYSLAAINISPQWKGSPLEGVPLDGYASDLDSLCDRLNLHEKQIDGCAATPDSVRALEFYRVVQAPQGAEDCVSALFEFKSPLGCQTRGKLPKRPWPRVPIAGIELTWRPQMLEKVKQYSSLASGGVKPPTSSLKAPDPGDTVPLQQPVDAERQDQMEMMITKHIGELAGHSGLLGVLASPPWGWGILPGLGSSIRKNSPRRAMNFAVTKLARTATEAGSRLALCEFLLVLRDPSTSWDHDFGVPSSILRIDIKLPGAPWRPGVGIGRMADGDQYLVWDWS